MARRSTWWLAGLLGLLVGACTVNRKAERLRGSVPGADAGEAGSSDGAAADGGGGPADGGTDATPEGGPDAASDGAPPDGGDGCMAVAWFSDCDGDGYAAAGSTAVAACARPLAPPDECGSAAGGWTDREPLDEASSDCDDGDPDVHPGATERCNGMDDDCDGRTDEEGAEGATVYYRDGDGDGYGVDGSGKLLCAPDGDWTATEAGDCDDEDADVHPGATAPCNGRDDDCDGLVDDDDEFAGLDADERCTGANFANHGCTVLHWPATGAAYLLCRGTAHNWWGARDDCTRNGSGYDLVAIESAEEQRWLEERIGELTGPDGWSQNWWIGARDDWGDASDGHEAQQHWFWVATGQEFCEGTEGADGCTAVDDAYVHWGGSDPDRTGDCAVMSRGNGSRLRGGWYDRQCWNVNWFVCESPPAGR